MSKFEQLPCTTDDLPPLPSEERLQAERKRDAARRVGGYKPSAARAKKRLGIELGLNKLIQARLPGQTFSQLAIAKACGVSHTAIDQIEKKALRKARQILRKELGLPWGEFFTIGRGML